MILTPASTCLTCLSTTRNMHPIEDASFFTSLTFLKLSDSSQCRLCWECYAAVRKAMLFRDKAWRVQAILTGQGAANNLTLSSLTSTDIKEDILCGACEDEESTNYPASYSCSTNQDEEVKMCDTIFNEISGQSPHEVRNEASLALYNTANSPQKNEDEELILKQEIVGDDPDERVIENDPLTIERSEPKESDEELCDLDTESDEFSSSYDEPLDELRGG